MFAFLAGPALAFAASDESTTASAIICHDSKKEVSRVQPMPRMSLGAFVPPKRKYLKREGGFRK